MDRRTLIAALGLAPASAVGAETFLTPPPPNKLNLLRPVSAAYDKETFARALELLAGELRSDRVLVESLNINTELSPDVIAGRHVLTLHFVYKQEA